MKIYWRILLSILSGILFCIAFPGFDQWYLAPFAFIPLIYAVDGIEKKKTAFLLGLLMGFTTNCLGYYWMPYTIHVFGGFNYPLTYFFFFVLAAYQALFFAFFAYFLYKCSNLTPGVNYLGKLLTKIVNKLNRDPGLEQNQKLSIPLWLSVPSSMILLEFIFPLLFPIYIANTLHTVPLLIQVVDIGGTLLLTFIVMFINAALYLILKKYIQEKKLNYKLIISIVVIMAFVLIYGAIQINYQRNKQKNAERVKIGLVQANMGIYEKWTELREGLMRHRNASYELAEKNVDLIVWPEAAYVNDQICGGIYPAEEQSVEDNQFYICPGGGCPCPERARRRVGDQIVPQLGVPLLFGVLASREGQDRFYEFNSAYILDSMGNILGFYDKKYLLAFGEYIPFGEWFPELYRYSAHTGRFTHGDLLSFLPFRNSRIATLICYEDILPGYTRDLVLATQPNLLVNITNDAWFGNTNEPWIHLALAKFRAIEHRLWLVRSTNTGVSAFIDPTGKVIQQSGVFVQQVMEGEVRLLQSVTIYQYIGDILGWIALVFFGFLFIATYTRKKSEKTVNI